MLGLILDDCPVAERPDARAHPRRLPGSGAAGCSGSSSTTLSLLWASERVFDVDTKVDRLIDPIVEWPRTLFVLGAAFLIATAIWAYERSHDRLLPVAKSASDPAGPDVDDEQPVLIDARAQVADEPLDNRRYSRDRESSGVSVGAAEVGLARP